MDNSSPFNFTWGVDRDGYEIRRQRLGLIDQEEKEFVVARGGPERRYAPLEDPTLWLRFGETCRDHDGVLAFATEFGLLREPNQVSYGAFGRMWLGPGDRLADTLQFAARARDIARLLDEHNRQAAMALFNSERPTMTEYILWKREQPERFDYRWVPISLRDALLHQIGDSITQNRQFRCCDNLGCPKWFRLGPQEAQEGAGRRTTTVRRRFCSDYCRVAAARRQKREAATHA
jgi:hypothetical protein